MNEIILSVSLLLIVSIISVFVKLKSMGLNTGLAISKTLTYPIEITLLHLKLIIKYKDEPLRVKVKVATLPITNPAETLSSYGIMYLQKQEFIIALEEVMNDLSEEGKTKLINKLVETGMLIKVEPKNISNQEDDLIYIENGNYSLNNKNKIFC